MEIEFISPKGKRVRFARKLESLSHTKVFPTKEEVIQWTQKLYNLLMFIRTEEPEKVANSFIRTFRDKMRYMVHRGILITLSLFLSIYLIMFVVYYIYYRLTMPTLTEKETSL